MKDKNSMRKLALCLSALLILPLMGAANAGKRSAITETTMFTDDSGDTHVGVVEAQVPGGFDLIEGKIKKVKNMLEFTVTHADMPPLGTLPESLRFIWAFSVDEADYRIVAKSADLGRQPYGVGGATDGPGEPSLDGHFRLEGECTFAKPVPGVDYVEPTCALISYVEGAFDPASLSFSVNVPLRDIEGARGSVLGHAQGWNAVLPCPICWYDHERYSRLPTMWPYSNVIDAAESYKQFKIP